MALRPRNIIALIALSGVLVFTFQNCSSQVQFESMPDEALAKDLVPESFKASFSSSQTVSGSAQMDVSAGWISSTLVMDGQLQSHSVDFSQIERPTITQSYTQGQDGTPVTDQFTQASSSGVVDILIVIDNSGSMRQEQIGMADRMQPLLSAISGANWRIGVVTTRESDGCMRAVINKGDADAEQAYRNALDAGASGGIEKGILQALNGLDCQGTQWLRTSSTLAVLFVTDEDDDSTETPENLYTLIRTQGRQLGTNARFYGLLNPNQEGEYKTLVEDSNGLKGDVGSSDYTPVLQQISSDIATILQNQFELSATPDADVTVLVENDPRRDNFKVEGNVLTFFDPIPQDGATITASYTANAVPKFNSVTLSEKPLAGSLSVKVNGQALSGSEYSLDNDSLVLSFVNQPADSAAVQISFKKNLDLLTGVALLPQAIAESITLVGAGSEAIETAYNPETGSVEFIPTPSEGQQFQVQYKTIAAPILQYSIGVAAQNLEAWDLDSNDPIPSVVDGYNLSFYQTDYSYGRQVGLRFQTTSSGEQSFSLPDNVDLDSLALLQGADVCILYAHDRVVSCDITSDITVELAYNQTVPISIFNLDLPDSVDPEQGQWTVKINGLVTTAYERTGSQIQLINPILDAEVEVFFDVQ